VDDVKEKDFGMAPEKKKSAIGAGAPAKYRDGRINIKLPQYPSQEFLSA
jgi:hypothetical protein